MDWWVKLKKGMNPSEDPRIGYSMLRQRAMQQRLQEKKKQDPLMQNKNRNVRDMAGAAYDNHIRIVSRPPTRQPRPDANREIVLREAKSPKALAHKRKYETKYESSPSRKRYRRELERERRKRGVDGKGGKDMSHTKTGKIVPEDPHTNRARSHPSVGSTLKSQKKIRIIKAPVWDVSGKKKVQVAGQPTELPNLDEGYEQHEDFPYDYFTQMGNMFSPNNKTYLYQSKDGTTRAFLENNPQGEFRMPMYSVHQEHRGSGKGRKNLAEMNREMREIDPEFSQSIPVQVKPEKIEFWEKMHNEGLADYRNLRHDKMRRDHNRKHRERFPEMYDKKE